MLTVHVPILLYGMTYHADIHQDVHLCCCCWLSVLHAGTVVPACEYWCQQVLLMLGWSTATGIQASP